MRDRYYEQRIGILAHYLVREAQNGKEYTTTDPIVQRLDQKSEADTIVSSLNETQRRLDVQYGHWQRHATITGDPVIEMNGYPPVADSADSSTSRKETGKVYPFGYNTPNAVERLQLLMWNDKTIIVDTRYTPWSNNPYFRRYGKNGLSEKYGHRYILSSVSAEDPRNPFGNVNYKNGGAIQLVSEEITMRILTGLLKQGMNIILLCACEKYEKCHRRVIVEMLKTCFPEIEIVFK